MGDNYPVGWPLEPPTMHCLVDNTQFCHNLRHIFNCQKF